MARHQLSKKQIRQLENIVLHEALLCALAKHVSGLSQKHPRYTVLSMLLKDETSKLITRTFELNNPKIT